MRLYKPVSSDTSIKPILDLLLRDLLDAPQVNTGHWQAKRGVPQVESRELLNVVLEVPISASKGGWASWMRPNLPWAEDHFQERVSGDPLNPPPSHVYWPFNQKGNKDHLANGQVFSHSYPERMWPRYANRSPESSVNRGIRYSYGDLDDAVDLLINEPYTRQCYVPIWGFEDLHAAAQAHERVPCTLGWHFILRETRLHCFYPMRSLDVLRYAVDDLYMAGRLCQWLIARCRIGSGENSVWQDVTPGTLTMHVVSCHCFEGDLPIIRIRLEGKKSKERMKG